MKNKNELNYQQARTVRKQSLKDVIADELIRGKGLGSAITGAIGLKTQARVKGIKAKFDPLNLVKFLTFGSRLGPALYGKLFGRSQKDVEYFTGRAKPIGRGGQKLVKDEEEGDENTGGMKTILKQILTFLQKSHESDMTLREEENNLRESNKLDDDVRHRELLKALGARTTTEETATLVEKPKEDNGFLNGLMDSIRNMFKGISDKISSIMDNITDLLNFKKLLTGVFNIFRVLGWFLTPAGGVLLTITAAAGFLWVMKKTKEDIEANPYDPEYKDNPYAMKLRGEAETVKQAAAINQREALKKIPRREIADAVADPNVDDKITLDLYGATKQELQNWLNSDEGSRKGAVWQKMVPERKNLFQSNAETKRLETQSASAEAGQKPLAGMSGENLPLINIEPPPKVETIWDKLGKKWKELSTDEGREQRTNLPSNHPRSQAAQEEWFDTQMKIILEHPLNPGLYLDKARQEWERKYPDPNNPQVNKPLPPPVKDLDIKQNVGELSEELKDLTNQVAVNRKKVISIAPAIASASTSPQTQSRPIPMPSVRMAENSYKNAVYSSFG